jgi:hypothetical protein
MPFGASGFARKNSSTPKWTNSLQVPLYIANLKDREVFHDV